jgi:hypothetical protein
MRHVYLFLSAIIYASSIQGGRSVVCSLSVPCSRVLQTFSEIVVLGSGSMIYFGQTSRSSTYFENIGFEKPKDQSDAQFLLSIASDSGIMKKTDQGNLLCQYY